MVIAIGIAIVGNIEITGGSIPVVNTVLWDDSDELNWDDNDDMEWDG